MKKFKTISIFILSSALLLFACAPTANIKREAGMLNLNYTFPEITPKTTSLAIAVVSPTIADKDFSGSNRYVGNLTTDFNFRFYRDYIGQLKAGFSNAFQELVVKKGFNIKGPFPSFDELTFKDKRDAYLALVPALDVAIEKLSVRENCEALTNVCTETGIMQIGGELRLDFIAPMTKEKVLVRRINLSTFRIQKDYKIERPPLSGFGSLISGMREFVDTSDKALADASNEFFKKSMEKIWDFVSTEELIRYKNQVSVLKNLKRF